MTPTTAAIVRELESVARDLRREAKGFWTEWPIELGRADGMCIAARICTRRASALRAKTKRKGKGRK